MKYMLYANKLFCLLMIICGCIYFCACSDKETEDFSDIPGVQNETWPNIVKCDSHSEIFVYTFEALDDWSVASSVDWCEVSPTSGYQGKSYLKIIVDKNETELERTATITINVKDYKAVSFSLEQEMEQVEIKPDPVPEINLIIDDYLGKNYLWNDDYKKLSRDLTIPYVDFHENFLRTTLMSMTTNTLDKKWRIVDYDAYGNPIYGYMLYSNITRMSKGFGSRNVIAESGVNHGVKKEREIKSYGFSLIKAVQQFDDAGNLTDKYKMVVQAVYPNSQASTLGVNRGTIITRINDREITESNYISSYFELLSPTQSNIKLSVEFPDSIAEVLLVPSMLDPTPILAHKILEEGEDKIGYLMYDSFDAAYDDDLLEVLAEFKSKGITDLILDLRYNGGGHVMSSNMISSCLIGDGCKDEVFHYYRYNASRMDDIEGTQKETGNTYDDAVGLFGEQYMYDDYYGVHLAPYSLNLKRLFVLTTKATASASEAVINALKGYGVPVIIIGEDTNGKNVGMETCTFSSGGYIYELAPITFQNYNAKKETVPSGGFSVDYAVPDWNDGYVDFGDLNEPMFKKAYELIRGSSRAVTPPASRRKINGQIVNLPIVHKRLEGMIIRLR